MAATAGRCPSPEELERLLGETLADADRTVQQVLVHEADQINRGRANLDDQADFLAMTSYAGVYHDVEAPIAADNHGVLFLNSAISYEKITDGSSQTVFVGEKLNNGLDLGWASGTRG